MRLGGHSITKSGEEIFKQGQLIEKMSTMDPETDAMTQIVGEYMESFVKVYTVSRVLWKKLRKGKIDLKDRQRFLAVLFYLVHERLGDWKWIDDGEKDPEEKGIVYYYYYKGKRYLAPTLLRGYMNHLGFWSRLFAFFCWHRSNYKQAG